jgi:hypothetical protein
MPNKPLRFVLEFTGWQPPRVADDGAVLRPPTPDDMVTALAEDLQYRAAMGGMGRLRVTVKKLP